MNGNLPFDPQREAALLSAYVDGELEAADVARIEAFLAMSTEASEAARAEIAKLRRLNQMTGSMRLKEPPAEEWEVFWSQVYNRAERSLGWLLLVAGVVVLGGWALLQVVTAVLGSPELPLYVKGGIFAAGAGVLVLLVSVIRERVYRRRRSRYKDVIR